MAYRWRLFFAGVVLGIGGFIAMFLVGTHNLDKSAESYARLSAIAIFSTWDDKQLLDRASAAFLVNTTPDAIHSSFGSLSKLGRLIEVNRLDGGLRYNISLNSSAMATYTATAQFDKGKLHFQIDLIKTGADWKIQAFRITTL